MQGKVGTNVEPGALDLICEVIEVILGNGI